MAQGACMVIGTWCKTYGARLTQACAVRGDLIRILNKLLKRKNKLDAILIETTGLANPAPVIQTFFVDEDIKDACQLDAVLTVIDTKHCMQHLDEIKPDGVINEAGMWQGAQPACPLLLCPKPSARNPAAFTHPWSHT